jgi:hypothetical protein
LPKELILYQNREQTGKQQTGGKQMKKLSVIALAVAACMLFAIPAMAVDVDFSGYYRVRGFFDDTQTLNDDTRTAQAKWDQRFRIQPVFKITDRLTLNTKFEGLDRMNWGQAESNPQTDKSFDMERAWVNAQFDMFTLEFGRMVAGTCGLQYCNADSDADRIKVILKGIDPFYLDFTYSKYIEADYDTTYSDLDKDGYAVMGAYKVEGIEAGLLLEYVDDKTNSGTGATPYSSQYTIVDPFFKGVFGMVTVEAEAQWFTGDYADYDGTTTDMDYDAMRFVLDVGFDFGMMTAGVGYAHSDGRSASEQDMTRANFGGNDWEPFLIMTGYFDQASSGLLGGKGNFNEKNALRDVTGANVASGTKWGDAGYDIFYVYGSYPVTETLTLNAIWGMAQADETSRFNTTSEPDDAIGMEFDIGAKWQIMDNMTYDVKFGYFSPDDFWKLGVSGAQDPDETYSVMHSVVVTF